MIPATTLSFTGVVHERLRAHLFPGDGLEAAAILICSRTPGPRVRLLVRDVVFVPYNECQRSEGTLTWPGGYLETAIDRGEENQDTLILLHSHPGGFYDFSDLDDCSDHAVVPSLFHAFGELHGTAIMVPNGAVRARLYRPDLTCTTVDLVSVAGHDLQYWWAKDALKGAPTRRPLAFSSGMRDELGGLTAGLIGLSGTGSVSGEAIARLGFGRILAIEFDVVELRNLDRILNSTLADAAANRLKVDVYAEAVARHRGGGVVETVAQTVRSREAVLRASQCDVLVCNVDTEEARWIADLIGAAFIIPLFDVGVTIPVRRAGSDIAIADVCGRIDYVQPGRSTLWDRQVYTAEGLRAEYLRRVAPEEFDRQVREGYFKGFIDQAPAVVTLNMQAASICINEFVARAYPFRLEPNNLYARTFFSLAACEQEYTAEDAFRSSTNPMLARGAKEPLLGLFEPSADASAIRSSTELVDSVVPHAMVA